MSYLKNMALCPIHECTYDICECEELLEDNVQGPLLPNGEFQYQTPTKEDTGVRGRRDAISTNNGDLNAAYVQENLASMNDQLAKTFDKVDNTLNKSKEVYESVKEMLNPKAKLAYNLPYQKTSIEKTTPEGIAEQILLKNNIVVYSGSGISVASGLATFRNEGGFWLYGGEKYLISQILSTESFKQDPLLTWTWAQDFRRQVALSGPNPAHFAIASVQRLCQEKDINFTLITENFDGFHVQAANALEMHKRKSQPEESKDTFYSDPQDERYGFTPEVYEVRGNANFMSCSNFCSPKLYASPPIHQNLSEVPRCPKCGELARPHILFVDEFSSEEQYRAETVLRRVANVDCIILIGNALESHFSTLLLSQAVNNDALIIDINTLPACESGRVRQLQGKAETLVPQLCKIIVSTLTKPKVSLDATNFIELLKKSMKAL
eukprot:TRINITY_DN464_c0_g2_i2.p1 TRINITY_DN464_c0_g2~~TRINITY_DN464_c0_g2_i2.p1  ORF type:complete len:437 (+),score=78.51 TRINITY_DN464_c0_g2_i2:177-1487(+)